MPIRLNLLAEQIAAEEARRRDPVKRAIWAAGAVVALLLAWSAVLQVKVVGAGSRLKAEQAKLASLEKQSSSVAANLKRQGELERKIAALRVYAANRFLWGNQFNALQSILVDNVQVTRVRCEQSYSPVFGKLTEKQIEANPKAKPPEFALEKIGMTIDANDFGNPADLNYNRFISAVGEADGFKSALDKSDGIVLRDRLPPQTDPTDPRRQFIHFSIECKFPEKKRTL